jgi:hypothetical protein
LMAALDTICPRRRRKPLRKRLSMSWLKADPTTSPTGRVQIASQPALQSGRTNMRKLLIYVVLAIVVLLAIAQFGPSLVFGSGIYDGKHIQPPAHRDAKA